MKAEKLLVFRGATYEAQNRAFYRFNYQIEACLEDGEDLSATRAKLVETVDGWLKEDIAKHSQSALAKLNPAKLDTLPWKPYQEGHRAAWIFAETKGAEPLVQAIRRSETGKIEVGGFSYKLSGPEENPNLFISRTPVKGE
jgi:hypothetical protein